MLGRLRRPGRRVPRRRRRADGRGGRRGRATVGASGRPAARGRRKLRGAAPPRPRRPAPREHLPSGDDRLFLYTGGTDGRPEGIVWRVEDYYLQGWEAARPGTEPPRSRARHAGRQARRHAAARVTAGACDRGARRVGDGDAQRRRDRSCSATTSGSTPPRCGTPDARERVAVMSVSSARRSPDRSSTRSTRPRAHAGPVVATAQSCRRAWPSPSAPSRPCSTAPGHHHRRHARRLGGHDRALTVTGDGARYPRSRQGQRPGAHRRRSRRRTGFQ